MRDLRSGAMSASTSAQTLSVPSETSADEQSNKTGTALGTALPAFFALGLFAAFTVLFLVNPDIYLAVIQRWMPYAGPVPFGDTMFLTAQLECWRAGVDVYTVNPCDSIGRLMDYSPLWLRLWFLPGSSSASVPLAITFILGFILSLRALPRVAGKTSTALLLAAIASPATAYAVERANVDLVIFILAALALLCAERSFRVRTIGHALLLFAGLLKFYPLTTLILILRERPRTATILECAALVTLAAFALGWRHELALMLANIPQPIYSEDGLGGRRLPEALVVIVTKGAGLLTPDFALRRPPVVEGMIALLLGALALAHAIQRAPRFQTAFRALSERETLSLILGSALYCGCFVAGASFVYREILLLFAIPALSRFLWAKELAWPVRSTILLTVGLMWSLTVMDLVSRSFGDMVWDDWPAATFAFWVTYELAAWWLFTVLLAALLCFARLSRAAPIAAAPREVSVDWSRRPGGRLP
jgi:hypothetical protein